MTARSLEHLARVPFPLDDVSGRMAVIGCGKAKHPQTTAPLTKHLPVRASEFYTGGYFQMVLRACRKRYDRVLIVSAEHGLVELDELLHYYDNMLPWSTRGANKGVIEDFLAACAAKRHLLGPRPRVDLHAGRNYARWFPLDDEVDLRWADWGPIGARLHCYSETR